MDTKQLKEALDRWGWAEGSGAEPNGPALHTLFNAVIDLIARVEVLEKQAKAALPLRYDVNRGAGHLAREYAAQDRVGARILTEPMGTWPGGECIVTAMHPDAESDIVLQVRRVQDGDEFGVFGYETVYEIAPKVFHPSGE